MLNFVAGFLAFPGILILASGFLYFYSVRRKIRCKLFGHKALWDNPLLSWNQDGKPVAVFFCDYCNGREERY